MEEGFLMKFRDGIIAIIVIVLILTGCSLNKDPVKDWIQIDISETNDLSSAFPKILGSLKTKEQFGTFKNALQSAEQVQAIP
jgi:PBP1b-binding outer membrane lipoprotein LpoB